MRAYADKLRRAHPEVRRIIWFGSWVSGVPSPGSDVDICLIVSDNMAEVSPRERVARYLSPRLPTGLDLVVYTASEFARLPEQAPSWHAAIRAGVDLAS